MRVLLCSHVAPPHLGGVETVVLAEARLLCAAGHQVTWVTSDASGAGEPVPALPGLELHRVAAWHALERRFGIAFPLFSPRLLAVLWRAARRADVIHVHGLVFAGSPWAVWFGRLHGAAVVVTDHGGLLRYPSRLATAALRLLFATVGRATVHGADRAIALNDDILQLFGRLAPAVPAQLLPNPVDRGRFQPPSPAVRAAARARLGWHDRPRVLSICRLLPHKGIDQLAAAADPAYEVVFCGPGDDATRARLAALGARCLPPRPQAELLDLYHAATAFALPSHNEGFPLVAQEALACGLPVVLRDQPAYAAYRNTPGLHLVAAEPDALRNLLRRLVTAAPGALAANPAATSDDGSRWLARLLDGLPTGRARGGLAVACGLLLALHLAFGLCRLPVGAVGKRASSIAEFTRLGETGWHHRHSDEATRQLAAWLCANVAQDQVVLWAGDGQGALQLLAPALFPRLLVHAAERRGTVDHRGRPIFTGRPPWLADAPPGVPVVVGARDGLRLEFR